MSRMIAVRSITGIPSAASRLRSWRGESSSSQATRFASEPASSAFSSSILPGPRYVFGCGWSRRWTSSPTSATPAVLEQLAQLGELLLAAVRHDRDQVGALARAPCGRWPFSAAPGPWLSAWRFCTRFDGSSLAGRPRARAPSLELADPLDRLEQPLVGRRQRDPEEALAARRRRRRRARSRPPPARARARSTPRRTRSRPGSAPRCRSFPSAA